MLLVLSGSLHHVGICWGGAGLVAAGCWVLERSMLPALAIWFPVLWTITMAWAAALSYLEASGIRGVVSVKLVSQPEPPVQSRSHSFYSAA